MNKDKTPFLFVTGIALFLGLSIGYVLGNWRFASQKVDERPKIFGKGVELIDKTRTLQGVSSSAISASSFSVTAPAPSTVESANRCPRGDGVPGGPTRPRVDIPADWPSGKRIVIYMTAPLAQSYQVACDLTIPAWNYLHRGHQVTIIVDGEAVAAFRRDGAWKTPLDHLIVLRGDLDDLDVFLEVPLSPAPKTLGELYRILASRGIRIVANEDALRARQIESGELDPVVSVLDGSEVQRLTTNLDAFLPYSGERNHLGISTIVSKQ